MSVTTTQPLGITLPEIKQKIDQVFESQQKNRYHIANTTARQRIAKLKSLLNLIYKRKEDIRAALYADSKKPAAEVDLSEIFVVTSELKHAIRHVKKWMKPKRVKPTLALVSTSSAIHYQPKGLVLIISPWNYPFNLTFGPLVSAIAAGNCAIIKPSEYTPNTSALVKEMITEIFKENEVAIIEGDATVASELLKKPFNHIFFTGSPAVGKIVMKAAAENLTTVTLELGGKSPAIVDETANIRDAAAKITWGKFTNNGQTCIAPDYLFVHDSKYQELMQALKNSIRHSYGETDEAQQNSPDYARIISQKHHQRLAKLIAETVEMGANVEIGGKSNSEDNYISPTILSDVDPNSPAMQEEIFGPVLPVYRYQSLDEVLSFITARENPLSLYVFSKNKKNVERIISNTSAGGSCVNEVLLQYSHVNLPFGGINNSGFGNSHGFYGFRAFSHERPVLKHNSLSPLKTFLPAIHENRAKTG